MKAYFSLFVFLFLLNTSFAQLTVRNDAFIYATNEVVYVEDEVNLEEADASFYLRDDAQLIQGSGTTGNSGIGKLSVFQSGTVHNWAYNFWGSPVGNVDINSNGNSDFRPNTNFYDWTGNADPALHQITSTAASFTTGNNGTTSPLVISSRWLYAYNAGVDYYDWGHIGNSGNLPTGYGFTMKGSTGITNQLYDFRGKPNSGTISISVTASTTTLAGNPYPSAIDTAAFIHDTNNSPLMQGTLLFWDHDLSVNSHVTTNYIGGYAQYTISADGMTESFTDAIYSAPDANAFPSGIGTTSTSGKRVYRYLPIGQGFFIEGVTAGNVQFKNAHRVFYKQSDLNSEFFRTENQNNSSQNNNSTIVEFNYNELGYQIVEAPYKRFRLNINFDNAYTRQLLHNFHPDATDDFDYGLESNNSEPASNDAYYILGDMPYITQAHDFDIDLKIPLVVKVEQNMPIEMHLFDVQNFGDQDIYIHDLTTDLYYNLIEQNFQILLDAGVHDNRFEITFKNGSTLSISEFENSDFSIFQNNTLAQLVVSNPNKLAIKSIQLIDVAGKQIINKVDLTEETRYEFSTKNLSDGVYIVSVSLENNEVQNKKIIVSN
ncbi:T9SS type A sorting domain-containing protein [uncultured Lacinutrix sp.]|uniref:T9SS type A sorting domain-containing protein n=1 Tax=uncultured Lacinutrix sp. TaxID=574032 RepID=UPI00263457E7|nr:T9SS type A sorting domain-containing protein [uncultured Lacinutrix sp.]